MTYRPEIDGLRALAVIPVIFFHAGFGTFSGGFVGVDVFFVISGYLITSIILSEMDDGRFSLVSFYERRARRILPALFVVLLVCLPLAWHLLMPSDMIGFAKSLIAVSLFSSNILFWSESGYWDTASELKPLLHTWSLAVEEQYYLLFPLFLMLTWHLRKRWILSMLLVIAGISLAVAHWGAYHRPSPAFFLLPTRGWELALGAAVAFFFIYRGQATDRILSHRAVSEPLSLAGLLMIAYAVVFFDDHTPFPSLYTLVPTLGAGLIVVCASGGTWTGRALSSPPFVGIGLISYSAYLWHQPLFAFARHTTFPEPGRSMFALLIMLTLVLAYLSWKLVETPFRNRRRIGRWQVLSFAIAGSLVFVGCGVAGYSADGFTHRSIVDELRVRQYDPDNRSVQLRSWAPLRNLSNDRSYGVEGNSFDSSPWFDMDDSRTRMLLVGNSHSKDLYNLLSQSRYANTRFQLARFGIQLRDALEMPHRLLDAANYKAADIVMVTTRYSLADLESLDALVQRFLADGKRVVIVRNTFEYDYYSNKTLADHLFQKKYLHAYRSGRMTAAEVADAINHEHYRQVAIRGRLALPKESDERIDALARRFPQVRVLDRLQYLCDFQLEKCYGINDEFEKYFFDYGHNTLAGAKFFGDRIDRSGWLDTL